MGKQRGETKASKLAQKWLTNRLTRKDQKSQASQITKARKSQNKLIQDSFNSKFK